MKKNQEDGLVDKDSSDQKQNAKTIRDEISDVKDLRDEIDKQLREAKNTLEADDSSEKNHHEELLLTDQELQEEITLKKKKLKELVESCELQQKSLVNYNEKVSGIESIYSQKERNLKDISETIDKLTSQRAIFEELEIHLTKSIEEMQKQIKDNEIKYHDLLEKVSQIESQHKLIAQALETITIDLQDRRNFISTLNRESLELKEQVKNVKETLNEKEDELAKLKNYVKNI